MSEVVSTPAAAPAAPPPAAPATSEQAAAPSTGFLSETPVQPAQAPAQAAPQAPAFPEGDWRSALPEDLRNDPSLKVVHDVPALAKMFIHAQKAIGAEKVPLPSKHATKEEVQAFYDKLGRPPLDKYEVKAPANAKYLDAATLDKLKPIAHEAGIMPQQLEAIAQWYEQETDQTVKAHQEAIQKEIQQGFSALKQEWGQAFDQKGSFAKRLFSEHGSPELLDYLKENVAVGSNPHLIRFAARVGEMLYKEDSIKADGATSFMLTPSEALQKANAIMAEAGHPYHNPEHPNHKAAVKEVEDLFASAYPKMPQDS